MSPLNSAKLDVLNSQFSQHYPLAILVVDDEDACRSATEGFLKFLGYSPKLARSGKEAIALVGSEPFDLVLMDIRMPGLDGYVTTDTMKLVYRDKFENSTMPKIVALSSLSRMDNQPHFHENVFFDRLRKPIEVERLADLLVRVFQANDVCG